MVNGFINFIENKRPDLKHEFLKDYFEVLKSGVCTDHVDLSCSQFKA